MGLGDWGFAILDWRLGISAIETSSFWLWTSDSDSGMICGMSCVTQIQRAEQSSTAGQKNTSAFAKAIRLRQGFDATSWRDSLLYAARGLSAVAKAMARQGEP
jgi:hypothetical protein